DPAIANEWDSIHPVGAVIDCIFRSWFSFCVIKPSHKEDMPLAFFKWIVGIGLFVVVVVAVFPSPLSRVDAGKNRKPEVHGCGQSGMKAHDCAMSQETMQVYPVADHRNLQH